MSTVPSSKNEEAPKPKVYYSARGGSRSKGAESATRTNMFSPPPTVIEAPLPRGTSSHYLRGGRGNEWDYVVEDGVFERAMAHDRRRLQELEWREYDRRIARTGLRGGAAIPKKKVPNTEKAKTKGLAILRKRAASFPVPRFIGKSLEQRLRELSIASTKDTGPVALSNYIAPALLPVDDDSSSLRPSSVDSSSSPFEVSRVRSPSLSTVDTELQTPKSSPTTLRGNNNLLLPGILDIKPGGPHLLDLEDTGTSELSIGSPAIAL